MTPEERASAPVSSAMRRLEDTEHLKLTAAMGEAQITLKVVRDRMVGDISRLPVIDAAGISKYIIHASMIDRYLARGGRDSETLETFLAECHKRQRDFGPKSGFVLIGPQAPLAAAKSRLESAPSCQDIFVTTDGTDSTPLLGWISNVRLSKYLRP